MYNHLIERGGACDEEHVHLSAYNAAFYELGLKWHWDSTTYRTLLSCEDDDGRIRRYIEARHPHLLSAYDIDFLVRAIQEAKARCFDTLKGYGTRMVPDVDWAAMQTAEVGF
jgi:hypothetical protein